MLAAQPSAKSPLILKIGYNNVSKKIEIPRMMDESWLNSLTLSETKVKGKSKWEIKLKKGCSYIRRRESKRQCGSAVQRRTVEECTGALRNTSK